MKKRYTHTPEQIAKMRQNHWAYGPDRESVTTKMSQNHWTKRREMTEDHSAKLSANHWTKRPDADEIKARRIKTLRKRIES
jgi:hypothetical protein